MSATKDGYDASRLLLSDLVRQFEVRGEMIAMVPNREDLLITGSEDEDGLRGMLSLAAEALFSGPLFSDRCQWRKELFEA